MMIDNYTPIDRDYDNIDLFVLEQRIYDVKEILRYLAETFPTFDADIYMQGSTLLQRAGSFIDGEIHNPTVIR
jgi:glutathione S-transferase